MAKPEITLAEAKKHLLPKKGSLQASDLIDTERLAELRKKAKAAEKKRKAAKKARFDTIDAYSAEIIARFGYRAYLEWNDGEIDEAQMAKWIMAERARDKVNILNLEAIIISLVSSCVRYQKGSPKPKGPAQAQKIYKEEVKISKGEI
ncbi:hypothetical protein IJH02_03220 [Candidatus Saccharibacteria bacterium]|nr:hypothetical protein [Candidatus Saccharibacteria bacterium]